MVLFPIQSTIEVPYYWEVCLLRWWKEKSMADHFSQQHADCLLWKRYLKRDQ